MKKYDWKLNQAEYEIGSVWFFDCRYIDESYVVNLRNYGESNMNEKIGLTKEELINRYAHLLRDDIEVEKNDDILYNVPGVIVGYADAGTIDGKVVKSIFVLMKLEGEYYIDWYSNQVPLIEKPNRIAKKTSKKEYGGIKEVENDENVESGKITEKIPEKENVESGQITEKIPEKENGGITETEAVESSKLNGITER